MSDTKNEFTYAVDWNTYPITVTVYNHGVYHDQRFFGSPHGAKLWMSDHTAGLIKPDEPSEVTDE